jgi:beta-lactamase class A
MRSRDRLLAIMRNTVSTSLLPKGIGKGSDIAHKTGTLAKLLADTGLVDLPNGRRYGIAVLAERAPNDPKAAEAIRDFSRTAYSYFSNLPPIAR